MSGHEVIALILIIAGAVVALLAAIGLQRFPDVLTRMHAASKPQTLGLILVTLGVAFAWWTPAAFGLMLLVLLAQMLTVPVASTMVARASFRRGFVRGSDYAIDELSPRLAHGLDEDDDEDGFIDEDVADEEGAILESDTRFPENAVGGHERSADLTGISNWDQPEPEPLVQPEELDVDEEAIIPPAEATDEEEAARRRRRRLGRRHR